MNRLIPLSLSMLLVIACDQPAEPAAERLVQQVGVASAGSTATDLGTLGGTATYAADINNQGVVVGRSATASGAVHAFRWADATGMTDLGTLPGGRQSGAIRILNSGKILGWSETADGKRVPVQWSGTGRIQALEIPRLREVFSMEATDFNERGEVVGYAIGDFMRAWFWSRKTGTINLSDLIPSCLEDAAYTINSSGLVAGGYCGPSGGMHPFSWRLGKPYINLGVGDDIGNATGVALAINNAGTVAGWLDPHGNVFPNAAIWIRGRGYTLLPNLVAPFPNSIGNGVNNRGVVVGGGVDGTTDALVPVAWPTPTTLVRLNADGLEFAVATAINDRGRIVGYGLVGGVTHALLWRLSDGRAENLLSPGGAAPVAGMASVRGAATGPASCLSDRKAMASKAALAECVMGVR